MTRFCFCGPPLSSRTYLRGQVSVPKCVYTSANTWPARHRGLYMYGMDLHVLSCPVLVGRSRSCEWYTSLAGRQRHQSRYERSSWMGKFIAAWGDRLSGRYHHRSAQCTTPGEVRTASVRLALRKDVHLSGAMIMMKENLISSVGWRRLVHLRYLNLLHLFRRLIFNTCFSLTEMVSEFAYLILHWLSLDRGCLSSRPAGSKIARKALFSVAIRLSPGGVFLSLRDMPVLLDRPLYIYAYIYILPHHPDEGRQFLRRLPRR